MKLLIVTQKVNRDDADLGFFHRWLEEFAVRCERLTVICLEKGEYCLPGNVEVLSLGKEEGVSRLKYLVRFFGYVWRKRKQYDSVFVHMNPEYVVLAGWLWRRLGKAVLLWYTHRQVHWKLRVAERFACHVFTASEKSFNLPSKKLHVVGHGVDTKFFAFAEKAYRPGRLDIVSVGRLTRIKNLDTLITAIGLLRGRHGINAHLALVGPAVTDDDHDYERYLRKLVAKEDLQPHVLFYGPVVYAALPRLYGRFDMSVNLAPTGGIDKVVFESMASGTAVFACNEAFRPYFAGNAQRLMFALNDPADLAGKIAALYRSDDSGRVAADLRRTIEEKASLSKLIDTILSYVR